MSGESEGPKVSDEVRKCVMFYIKPVKRILQLGQHKLLSNLHQSTPLNISLLCITPTTLTIDSLNFKYGSTLFHLKGHQLPESIKEYNKKGGFPFDVDKFGREIRDLPVLPGDIQIFRNRLPPYEGVPTLVPFDVVVRCQLNQNHRVVSLKPALDRKLYECMKFTTDLQLGGNRCHFVKNLDFGPQSGTFRLPVGLKLRIRNFIAYHNSLEVIESFGELLHEDSFPLNCLMIQVASPRDPIFRNKIVQEANELRMGIPEVQFDWCSTFTGLKNQKIQLLGNELHFKDLLNIARHWRRVPREKGCSFGTCSSKAKKAIFLLQYFLIGKESRINGRGIPGYLGMSVPVNDQVELNFYLMNGPGEKYPMMVFMESMERGTAEEVDVSGDRVA